MVKAAFYLNMMMTIYISVVAVAITTKVLFF